MGINWPIRIFTSKEVGLHSKEISQSQRLARKHRIYQMVNQIFFELRTPIGNTIQWEQCEITLTSVMAKIVMTDKTVLYHAYNRGNSVQVFREGPWLERIKSYSASLDGYHKVLQKQEDERQRAESLKPFSFINY